jgi:hypothetical protein
MRRTETTRVTKEHKGGANLALFCRRTRSFFVKLLPKKVPKKPLKGYVVQSLD